MDYSSDLMMRINSGVALSTILSNWLSNGPQAKLVFDQGYNIVWANRMFIDSLADYEFLTIDRGALRFLRSRDHLRLEKLIEDKSCHSGFLLCEINEGRKSYAIQFEKIPSSDQTEYFAIRITDFSLYLATSFRNFKDFFGLTNAEECIVFHLLSGHNVDEIYRKTGKSRDTTRFHIRNIYTKMNISSREELFANLRHFMYV